MACIGPDLLRRREGFFEKLRFWRRLLRILHVLAISMGIKAYLKLIEFMGIRYGTEKNLSSDQV